MKLKSILPLRYCVVVIALLSLAAACKNKPDVTEPVDPTVKTPVQIPLFMRDSAYAFVAKQVSFGPRVPGTDGHKVTREWLVQKFKSYGAKVTEQSFKATTATIGDVRATNIIASFNPTYSRRILLGAHWDTRFAADEDTERMNQPIDGADDGGSGVGVLIEIARLLHQNPIPLGVDFILFDVEDQGATGGSQDSWCLGAQYWGKNPHVKSYRAEYGILLDMVGAKGAVFQKEDVSSVFPAEKARQIHYYYDQVWALADGMKKGHLFINHRGMPFTDDHYYVNLLTTVPMIDIIHRPVGSQKGFGPHWHTHGDNMDIIDPAVLGSVGQVVTAFIYQSVKGDVN